MKRQCRSGLSLIDYGRIGQSNDRMAMFDIAQICPNGHVANRRVRSSPEFNKTHCEKCGEATITKCPACKAPIRGFCQIEGVIGNRYNRPAHCHECGAAFPWTARAIQAAIELSIEAAHVEGEEAEQLRESVRDIVRDTPRSPLGAERLRRFLAKMGEGAAGAVRDILVDVISESVRKSIWPTM